MTIPRWGDTSRRTATERRPIRLGRCGDLSVAHRCANLDSNIPIPPGGGVLRDR